MSTSALTTYLNDHLAGSVAGLELVDLLLTTTPEAGRDAYLRLRREIEEDQQVLRQIIHRLGSKESQVRKAVAWLAEKLGRAKFQFDGSDDGKLATVEALETLGLGIQGKLALWRALQEISTTTPELGALELPALQQRALEQFQRVDRLRLEAARAAFR